jgi:tetratricopeptide (TPR) repeat protein
MAQGDAAGAQASYRAYLALDDRAPRLQYKLGLALYRSGDAAGAAEAAKRALALAPSMAEADQLLGVAALAQGNYAEAAAALMKAVELQPADASTRSALADVLSAEGRTRDETVQREALAALDGARPEGLVSLALAQVRHGRTDAALSTLTRAADRFPGSPLVANASGRVWLDLAESTGDTHDIQQAIDLLRPVAGRESAPSETLALYGRALLLNGDLRPAEAALLRATTKFPIERNAFLTLSRAEARLGNRNAARAALERHRALNPER